MKADGRSFRERLLVLLLRCAAVVLLSAFLAMAMPTRWMAGTHRWLGMGEFPASPLVDYLTRSVAAMYGFHGVLLAIVSRDVRRYRGLVVFVAWMDVVLGLFLLGIDLHAGMPWWWTAIEGPPIALTGILLAWLLRAVP